jgi:pyruvate decarboxylase
MDADYNDINTWNNKDLVNAFGGEAKKSKTFQVKTKDEVHKLFEDSKFNAAETLQFVEVYIPKEDAPRALKLTAQASAKVNAKKE